MLMLCRRWEGCGAQLPKERRREVHPPAFRAAWSSPPAAGSIAHLHPTVQPVVKAPCLPVRATGVQASHEMCLAAPVMGHPIPAAKTEATALCWLLHPKYPSGKGAAPLATSSSSSLALLRPAIKLVNTWTRLTKHSSRRKWGVCRNTPLHIVMADINSMLITLCTFQSHILKPFR